ncbi:MULTISPECIES: DUF2533 family protein [Bacillaceae]|uniref:DUF2533 family protein n=1 Tax=Bacillaceae TaxID=186817 RepID=UPI0004E10D7A|nr:MULTISPECIES: DUF2533 family protein [Bacillaceae]MCF2650665.1 DUF2533 family protein [Niallia circulans]MCM3364647.1 YpbS family protein [Niallia sp. MER TA 168]CAI9396127.1 hypothetical protein BACSP_04310 [Bacillus sp. T2.9-1]
MSVHKEITKHVEQVNSRVIRYKQLDQLRESFIEEALLLCKAGETFSVGKINVVTEQINELARLGVVPTRKKVTKEMVIDFVNRSK